MMKRLLKAKYFQFLIILWSASLLLCISLIEATNFTESERNTTDGLPCEQKLLIEKEYVLLENKSVLLPESKYLYSDESYSIENGSVYICAPAEETVTVADSENAVQEFNFSQEFLDCRHILIDNDEHKILENGTLHVEIYNAYYEPSNYYLQKHGVYICLPDFSQMAGSNATNYTESVVEAEKFGPVFVLVTKIGISVSIVSLVLHLGVFCFVPKVRNLPGCCLASLSLSLLVAYLCFISASFVTNEAECASLGLCVYYFFLTSFFWMNAIAFDVWRSFRVVMKNLRIYSHRIPWRRFLLYSAYSWTMPALMVVFARLADSTEILPIEYRPSFGRPKCWFNQRKALLVFFAIPLCLIMALNAAFFLDSAYVISRATMKARHVNESALRKRFFMFMRLALLMGLTWIVGIAAGYLDQEFLWHIFVVLNTLQGLFIFIVFSCSAKVRGLVMKSIGEETKSRQGTSVRTISNVSAL